MTGFYSDKALCLPNPTLPTLVLVLLSFIQACTIILQLTICVSTSYEVLNETWTMTGFYSDKALCLPDPTLPTLVLVLLSFIQACTIILQLTICVSTSYEILNETWTMTGFYSDKTLCLPHPTLPTLVLVLLSFIQACTIILQLTICVSTSYEMLNETWTMTGFYSDKALCPPHPTLPTLVLVLLSFIQACTIILQLTICVSTSYEVLNET